MASIERGTHVIRVTALAAMAAIVLTAAAVHAQEVEPAPADATAPESASQPAPPRPRAPRSYFRGYVTFDSTALAASQTFDAVVGKPRLSMVGGGGELLDIWKGLFARVAVSSVKETGSRAELFNGEVIPLGIPLTVELRPLEVAAGWRVPLLAGRLVPYGGAGVLRMGYRETSTFAMAGEDTSETFAGSVVFGGVEARIVSWIVAGAEVQYRTVPDALGQGGLSEAFGESDLGGTTLRLLIGIRR